MKQELQKLAAPAKCGLFVGWMRQCNHPAHWLVLGSAHGPEVPVCDMDILLMADMNDDNQGFFQPALDEIAWRYERRRLFMSLMRQPDMRLLYKALWHLKWDKGVDWRAIQQIEMERYGTFGDCWLMITDRWLVTTLQANKLDLSTDDFLAFRLHDETDPFCECSDCREALMCHLSCKAYYVTLMEREQGAA